MDLLADILQTSGLKRRHWGEMKVVPGVDISFDCVKCIGLHFVKKGQIVVLCEEEKVLLQKGDLLLMSRGIPHILNLNDESFKSPVPIDEYLSLHPISHEDAAHVVSAAYQFWHNPIHPLFDHIPDVHVIRFRELEPHSPISLVMHLMSQELGSPDQMGSETIMSGLLDILFTHMLRQILQHPLKASNISRAISDERIAACLRIMHFEFEKPWTLDELAKRIGISKVWLSMNFKEALGQSPMHYLASVRIQKAMQYLSTSDDKLETIANNVGYSDSFGFSKAFKKSVGLSPKEFRRQDEESKCSTKRY